MNVGIVGAGLQGKRRLQALKQSKDAKLIAIADANQDAALSLARDTGADAHGRWQDITSRKDVDVVIICTPPNSHAQIANAAMTNGKHVLCEKPLAMNPEEAVKMVETAKRYQVRLKCGFNHRHHAGMKQAKVWIDQGLIGELINIRCTYGIGGRPGYDKEWRADAKIAGGGQLMDQGMHLIDLCRWYMGEYSEAFGYLATSFWDMPLEDNAFLLLRTQKGQVASIHASWTQWKNLFRFEIYGKDGYIMVDGLGGSYGTEKAVLGKRDFTAPFSEQIVEFRGEDNSWSDEWQEFMAAIRDGHEPLASGYDGLQAMRLAYAVYESSRNGVAVKLKA